MVYYIVIINIIAFLIYFIDKLLAIYKKYRIPEKTLLFISFLGGSLGSITGMMLCHHKTKKWYFWFINILLLIIDIVLCYNYL